jgi:hypothetical protein
MVGVGEVSVFGACLKKLRRVSISLTQKRNSEGEDANSDGALQEVEGDVFGIPKNGNTAPRPPKTWG